ncbi:MAG: nucleotide exchange factor GrpE [Nitrospinota bacterium]
MNKNGNKIEEKIGIPVEIKTEAISSADDIVELKRKLQEQEKEAKDTLDRLLRVRADFDNYQKRIKKEKMEFERFLNEGLIKELLPVVDNLERAMKSAKQSGEIAPLSKGLEMTIKQFRDILKEVGVKEIKSIGEIFDPSKHEAMKLITPHDEKDNTIVEEYEKGYSFHERVIRPSKVGVAKNTTGGKDSGVKGSSKINT